MNDFNTFFPECMALLLLIFCNDYVADWLITNVCLWLKGQSP